MSRYGMEQGCRQCANWTGGTVVTVSNFKCSENVNWFRVIHCPKFKEKAVEFKQPLPFKAPTKRRNTIKPKKEVQLYGQQCL